MRIVVVSAHYPPDFVSGGTLQPQRLARGLRDRGHDVSVYAGWIGVSAPAVRPPLEAWTDTDETGLPVRWIVSSPWIGWTDEANFDNHPVSDDFARHLATIRPDLVHFHSLQSLGAGLLPVAAAAGARVVVTMHDFWWCCARQFLVDSRMRPCSPVVDAGVCDCAVDAAWLARRNQRLQGYLRAADLVLCPSASAAALLAANGLGGDRLAVDENGLPAVDEVEPLVAHAADDRPVTFLYGGGGQDMKGAHVVVNAARLLGREARCRILAYGMDAYVAARSIDAATVPALDPRPPYDPADATRVFAEADVVLVPSVMRESHSLLTREALMRGIPVIATDSVGPEEVVVHGVNGLIVPAADPAALAAAIRSLTTDCALLGRLRAGCVEHPVRVRRLSDQVEGLDKKFTALANAPQRGAGVERSRPPIERVLFIVGIDGAPLRYRAWLPAEALGLLGVTAAVRHYRDPEVSELADAADLVVVYRVPATVQVLATIARIRARETPVLFDVDDLIFDPDIAPEIPALQILPEVEADLWLDGVHRYRTTLESCDGFIGSTDMLVQHAAAVSGLPAARFDNGVGLLLARRADRAIRRARRPGPVRIGYLSGTTTHDQDWFYVEPAVREVLEAHPDVELWLGGHLPETPSLAPFGARVRRLPLVPWLELPEVLRDLDINLAPLAPDSRFNEAKSAIKWLEAALSGTVTVASPTAPFVDAVAHGDNGVLAASVDEWTKALDGLVADDAERRRLAGRARRDALLRWSPHLQGPRYLDLLEQSFEWRTRTRPASTWVPVVHDEPAAPAPLDPYADPPEPAAALRGTSLSFAARARRAAGRVRGSIRDRGVGATARAIVRRGWQAVTRTAGSRRTGTGPE